MSVHEGEGHPTAWFDGLYADAAAGRAEIPWDRGQAHPLLVEWLGDRRLDGATAAVPGVGTGWDAELLAQRGADVVGFDVAPSAIEAVQQGQGGSDVAYVVADLLDLSPAWFGAFDLVVEAMTIQSMPRRVRTAATEAVARLPRSGGTLLVIGIRHPEGASLDEGPPWCLTENELAAFEDHGLERIGAADQTSDAAIRYLVEFRRR